MTAVLVAASLRVFRMKLPSLYFFTVKILKPAILYESLSNTIGSTHFSYCIDFSFYLSIIIIIIIIMN
jgi:hypothetical protein